MTKLLGALLVITGSVAFGYQSILKSRETVLAIRQLREFLTELSRAISFQLEPLPDAVFRLHRELATGEDSFLSLLSAGLESDPTAPFSQHFKDAVKVFSAKNRLPQKLVSILDNLGDSLGKMDYQTECDKLDRTSATLSDLLQDIEATTAKKEQTVKSLSILLGVFVVILLL